MPCFHPLHGFKSRTLNASGKRSITFNPSQGYRDLPVSVPCGQCIGCRLERSRQWAIRCVHEAQLHEKNSFITLTYDNENLPPDKSLHVDHFQKFMKRLRKRFGPNIRFFHCGEYGEKFARPHYHACLFNFDFRDKKLWKEVRGNKLYVSKSLEELWPFGFSTIGDVTFESAAYVARYITKKVTGKNAKDHYELMLPDGELVTRKPEYVTMSRRPGLASAWFQKYSSDVYPSDFIVMREKKIKPPKYYDRLYEHTYPEEIAEIKIKRKTLAKKHFANNTPERLEVRETIQNEKFKMLKRSYENETENL